MIHYTRIANGRFTSKPLRDLLLVFEGAEVEVMIRAKRRYPGPAIHRHYRGNLVPLLTSHLRNLGHDVTEASIHRELCLRFLTEDNYDAENDDYRLFHHSTSRITVEQFSVFVVKVEQWMTEFWHLRIPDRTSQFTLA